MFFFGKRIELIYQLVVLVNGKNHILKQTIMNIAVLNNI